MRIGVVYPQTEYGSDPAAIRAYARTVEDLGYAHVLAYDHVLGANPERPGGWKGPYTYRHAFLEPLALFSYMAAVTEGLELVTGILILPQRQTALVAKQTATLDVLSGGRLRLGVAIGWNPVEYEALGQDFTTRGRRSEEQVTLLRKLWTEPLVTFDGRWDRVVDAGINPLPVQRPIPIWFGGHADAVLRRVARMGDGWLPNYRTPEDLAPHLAKLHAYAREEGRDPTAIGVEPRINLAAVDRSDWRGATDGWAAAGATHLTVNTMGMGLPSPEAHLDVLRAFAGEVIGS